MIAGELAVNFPAFIGVVERLLVTPSGGFSAEFAFIGSINWPPMASEL